VIAFKKKNNIALFIAVLFHVCGLIGILCTPYKNWFIQNTPVNLLLMAILLCWTQREKNIPFLIFIISSFSIGVISEMIGVSTSLLFGEYKYGNILGLKLNNVPLLIGINWFIIIYCGGIIVAKFDDWIISKLGGEVPFSSTMMSLSFILDGALLATFFDWLIEPVAVKLGFWQWLGDGKIPLFNYTSWFIVSCILLTVFRKLKFDKHNHFAVHLFIIQVLFFFALRTFL
jgi:bisanhydrobacterioruberin hydratase